MDILEWVWTRKNKLESCSNLTWLLTLCFPHIILIFSLFCSVFLAWLKWSDIHIESTHMCSGSFLWLCWILFCWYRHLRCLQAQSTCFNMSAKPQMCPEAAFWITLFLSIPLPYFGLHTPSQYADSPTWRFYANVVLRPPFIRDNLPWALPFLRLCFYE